ncbi:MULTISPECIES: hypothetical protein [Nostoc]|uniref:Uncharacterized protein n=2 Tax=Nostoc TaxID=1177 RepID=A0ABR8ICX4_9NOSO|nr:MULTISPECIES: hypothetical protein [Nostoc]MBD2565441.1 hypothetical protein [Nostoc linckia FACHB-391]MBD2648677.1 hypothetical protein [Nostoc foliaceum FACHB-393]
MIHRTGIPVSSTACNDASTPPLLSSQRWEKTRYRFSARRYANAITNDPYGCGWSTPEILMGIPSLWLLVTT